MKRFHIHVHVRDLEESIRFYSALFGAEPSRHEPDYAKWMLEDPRVNFAISTRGTQHGVDHLGLQTDSTEELAVLEDRARAADLALLQQGEVSCCYARSRKHWLVDPQGVAWEQFHTLGDIPLYGKSAASAAEAATTQGGCCPSTARAATASARACC